MMRYRYKAVSFMIVISLFVSIFAAAPAVFGASIVSADNEDDKTPTTYKISTSVNSSARGRITATGSVARGKAKTIKVIPAKGYYLSDLVVDKKSVGAKYAYTFKNIDQSHTVKAVFSKTVKILLDAGHAGKYNRSPVYSSYYESDMNWKLHNYLKDELEQYNGFHVGVTRTSQAKDLAVYYRGKAAAGYDLFLSLHSNSSPTRSTDYPLIVTQKGDTNDPLAKSLAKTIQNTMKTKQTYRIWQRVESSGAEYYGVLRGSKSAGTKGMILEHSFHTNLTATKWLSNKNNLKKMAENEAKVLAKSYGLKLEKAQPKPEPEKPAAKTVNSKLKVKVLVGSLNMRKSYNTSSKAMGLAKKGKIYQLKAKTQNGAWGQIKENGYWIYLKNYTKIVKSASGKTPSNIVKSNNKVKVLVSSLNMRKSYSTSSKTMGIADKNVVYQLKAKTKDGVWGQIKSNNYWIYLKGYTKKVE